MIGFSTNTALTAFDSTQANSNQLAGAKANKPQAQPQAGTAKTETQNALKAAARAEESNADQAQKAPSLQTFDSKAQLSQSGDRGQEVDLVV